MSIRNFCPTAYEIALYMLGEGFIIVELDGNIVACFEHIGASYAFASSLEANAHFPNGQYLSAGNLGDLENFEMVARRLDYLAVCEEMDKTEELVHCLIEEGGEHLDVRKA